MSGITSGIGLVSGLPTASLIDQLMQLERRPVDRLQARTAAIQTQRTAFADISARLLAVKAVVARFGNKTFFQRFGAASSNPDVLTATAGENAAAGSFSFVVHSLVSNHQMIGRGFATPDSTPVGAGRLSIEIGRGKVAPATSLDQLNGGDGVRRGKFRITDRSGASAEVDLSAALTVDDVLNRINSQANINVRARADGDRIILDDLTGLTTGNLAVADLAGGHAAADLGLAQSIAGSRITGADVVYLTDSTPLAALNDGNGIRRHVAGNDFRIMQASGHSFDVSLSGSLASAPDTRLAALNNGNGVRLGTIRITDRSGATAEVDLTRAVTVEDVLKAINAAGIGISAIVVGSHFQLQDTTGTAEESAVNLKIEDVSAFSMRDLGIAADVAQSAFVGGDVYRITTIGDVIRAINLHSGNDGSIVASLSGEGNGITLTDSSGGPRPLMIEALDLAGNGQFSKAAFDLGIEGTFSGQSTVRRDLAAGLNTVLLSSLNGGAGIERGVVRFTSRGGTATEIDFSPAQTLGDVVNLINAVSVTSNFAASVNRAGNGIAITDLSSTAGANLAIEDVAGTTAADLGIAGSLAGTTINGANLQLRYVAENTRVGELNYGAGIRPGEFQITDSAGTASTVNVTQNQKTLGDIITLIKSSAANVTATINATGDGMLITDEAGGTGTLKIQDLGGGFAARDLNIARQAAPGRTAIDGTYEITIDIDADDALKDVAAKLNAASLNLRAGLLNDGSPVAGHRLTLTSQVGGRRGELVFDAGDTGLDLETLVSAQDAVVFYGGIGAEKPVVVTSSSNTLTDLIDGVTINLIGTAETPVTLSVSQDVDKIVEDLRTFVTHYNAVLDRIDELTQFNPDTLQRGLLLGDATLHRVESRLQSSVLRRFENMPESFSRLFALGLTLGNGARLEFDEERFRAAYRSDPASVEQLFTTEKKGIGDVLDTMLDELTRAGDGVIARADNLLSDREQLLQDRIGDLNIGLDKKRARLQSQFAALERSLSLLQGQQNALTALSQISAGATG